MENKFCLLNCRFDKKNKRKLLIQGYFEQNKLQGCRPIVSLDYQLLEYEVITRTILDNPLEYTEFGRQTKRYFLAVTLQRRKTKKFFMWMKLCGEIATFESVVGVPAQERQSYI